MNKAKLPTHVELHAYTTDMMKDSVILREQLRTVDKTRLKEKVCHLSHEYLEQVDRALMVSLELDIASALPEGCFLRLLLMLKKSCIPFSFVL